MTCSREVEVGKIRRRYVYSSWYHKYPLLWAKLYGLRARARTRFSRILRDLRDWGWFYHARMHTILAITHAIHTNTHTCACTRVHTRTYIYFRMGVLSRLLATSFHSPSLECPCTSVILRSHDREISVESSYAPVGESTAQENGFTRAYSPLVRFVHCPARFSRDRISSRRHDELVSA